MRARRGTHMPHCTRYLSCKELQESSFLSFLCKSLIYICKEHVKRKPCKWTDNPISLRLFHPSECTGNWQAVVSSLQPNQEIQQEVKSKTKRVEHKNGYNDGAICPHGCSNTVQSQLRFLAAPLLKCPHFWLLSSLVASLLMEILLSNRWTQSLRLSLTPLTETKQSSISTLLWKHKGIDIQHGARSPISSTEAHWVYQVGLGS